MFFTYCRKWFARKTGRVASRVVSLKRTDAFLHLHALEGREVPAVFMWDGDGGNNLISNASNWSGGVAPTGLASDQLVFPTGVANLTPQDDLAGAHQFNTFEFLGTGYTLSGTGTNSVRTQLIGSSGASNTLDASLALSKIQFVTAQEGTTLTINGALNLMGDSLTANANVNSGATGNVFNGKGSVTFTGVISDTGATPAEFQVDNGTVLFSGGQGNTYTGLTDVRTGTLQLQRSSATAIVGNLRVGDGSGAANTAVVQLLDSSQISDSSEMTINSDGKFDVNGRSEVIGSLAGSGNVDMGAGIFNVDQRTATAVFSGTISGAGNFQKSGGGKVLTLTGTSTFTGPTGVNQGTLLVDGSIATSSMVFVQGSGILGGIGTVGALRAQNGSRVAPGDSPGILNTGAVEFQAGSTLDAEIGGNTAGNAADKHDQLNVTGTVTLATTGAGVVLNLSKVGTPTLSGGDTLVLINNDGTADAITGTFVAGTGVDAVAAGTKLDEGAVVSNNFLGSGLQATITYTGGDGNDVGLKVQAPAGGGGAAGTPTPAADTSPAPAPSPTAAATAAPDPRVQTNLEVLANLRQVFAQALPPQIALAFILSEADVNGDGFADATAVVGLRVTDEFGRERVQVFLLTFDGLSTTGGLIGGVVSLGLL